jgi:hypothetical protein
MKANVNPLDRTLRFVLGAAALSLVFFGPQTAWGWLGLIAVVSAASGFCPLYRILGINAGCGTCEKKAPKVA